MFWCHLKVLGGGHEYEQQRQQMDTRLVHPSLPILHTPRLSSPSPPPQKFLSCLPKSPPPPPPIPVTPSPAPSPPPLPSPPVPPVTSLSLFYCSFQRDKDEATRLLGQKAAVMNSWAVKALIHRRPPTTAGGGAPLFRSI